MSKPNIEYIIQVKQHGKWLLLDGVHYYDIETAKRRLNTLRHLYDGVEFRLACREVGDWCECREG